MPIAYWLGGESGVARPHGRNTAAISDTYSSSFSEPANLDDREVAAGILEHHRFVHHRQFEVRRRIVDRDARVFGDRDDDQRAEREAERHAQADVAGRHECRDHRQLRRAGDQRERERDDDQRGFGERCDHDFAARADAAETGADVESDQREEEPRAAEQRNDGEQIRRDAENGRPVANVGTSDAAVHVAEKIRYGATRNSHDALSASTTSFFNNFRDRDTVAAAADPGAACSRALTLRTKPVSSGASASMSSI